MSERINKSSDEQKGRQYEAPLATRLPVGETLGGSVPACDQACEEADNTFQGSS